MSFKARILTRFPALVSVAAPLLLVKQGLQYTFSIDVASLASQIVPSLAIQLVTQANTWAANQLFSGLFGYTTGAGGAVTQTTSRTTAVIINKATGSITLFSAAGSTSTTSFSVSNTLVTVNDVVVVSVRSAVNFYRVFVSITSNGGFQVSFATDGGTSVDAPVFNFAVIKGSVT